MFLFVSIFEETYSYTLSLAMITQLPIIYLKKQFQSVVENRLEKYNNKYPFTNYKELYILFNQYKQDFFYTIEETLYFDTKWSNYFNTNTNFNNTYIWNTGIGNNQT